MYIIPLLMPQELHDRLRPSKVTAALPAPVLVGEVCTEIKITGLKNGPTTWYECVKTFSDGTVFRRVGDAKP